MANVEVKDLTPAEKARGRKLFRSFVSTTETPWAWGWYATGTKPGLGDTIILDLFPKMSALRASRIATGLRSSFVSMLPAGIKNAESATWKANQDKFTDVVVDSYLSAIVKAVAVDSLDGEPSPMAGKKGKGPNASDLALASKLKESRD